MPENNGFPSSDAGFSVLEVMVALLLLSALGVAVWAGLVGGQNLAGRAIRSASGTARLLQMEMHLRRTAAQVRTPYWAPGPGAEATADGLRIPWLNGRAEEALVLDWSEDRLGVRTGPSEPGIVFGPFAEVECEVYVGGPSQAAGLRVSVLAEAGDGEPLVIEAPFGGSPLAPGEAP